MRQGLAENIICLAQNVCCSVNRLYWRTQAHLIEIACLLIRSTARFIISLQGSEEFKRASDELTQSRHNHSVEYLARPLAPTVAPAYGNGEIPLHEHAFYGDEDGPLGRPEENDLSESRASLGSRRKLVAGTAVVAALGVCACAYFLLASSNKTVPQTAKLSAAVQPVLAGPGQNVSESFAAVDLSNSLSSRTPVQPEEPLDASQKVAWPALPTMPRSLTSVPARTEDILFLQRPNVNIRSTPSASGSVVATAPKGTRFKVTGREADWVKVQNGRLSGWVNAQFLAPTEPR